MSQQSKVIDLTRGYVPGDPNAFPQNLSFTEGEDRPEKEPPILPFEGYNFMPTIYGYRSYFGTNSSLAVRPLESRAQFILLFQGQDYSNILIALCEDGIWTALGDGSVPVWIQQVTHTFDANVYEEWTYCVIENTLYMYKQGMGVVYKNSLGDIEVAEIPEVPSIPAVIESTTPAIPGHDMINPGMYSNYFSINLLETGGDGNDFPTGELTVVSAAFIDTNGDISLLYDSDDLESFNDNSSVYINYYIPTNSEIPTGSVLRIWVTNDFTGQNYYKDYTLAYDTDTSIIITSISTFTEELGYPFYFNRISIGGVPEITITVFPEVPAIPAIPAQTINDTLTITSFTPTFLNMTGQMGIFKAGTRLGFWDSANSVSWSSNFELNNFTPSLENLAGNRIFGDVIGRIVTIKSHGEGYVIYGTKSIVGVNFSQEGSLLWDARRIFDNIGISYSRAVTFGQTDSDHIVFSTRGLYTIGKFNPITGKHENQNIFPEISDYLLEDRKPVYLTTSESRYLFLSLINPYYIYGLVSSEQYSVNPYKLVIDWSIPTYSVTPSVEILPGFKIYEEWWGRISGSPTPNSFAQNIVTDPNTGITVEIWPLNPDDGDINNGADPNRTSKRSRMDDREWIPLYHAEFDRMRTNLYAWWMIFRTPDETIGLDPYSRYSPMCNDMGTIYNLYQDLLDINFNAMQGATADKYGDIRLFDNTNLDNGKTMPGIRAFDGIYGASRQDNIKALTYGQKDEWEEYTKNQALNMARLESLDITEAPTIIISDIADNFVIPTNTNNIADFNIVGYVIHGHGNEEIISKEGPYEFSAIEVVYRRTFTKRYKITRRRRVEVEYSELPRLQPYYSGYGGGWPIGDYTINNLNELSSPINRAENIYCSNVLTLEEIDSYILAGSVGYSVETLMVESGSSNQVFIYAGPISRCPNGKLHYASYSVTNNYFDGSTIVIATGCEGPTFASGSYFLGSANAYIFVTETPSPRRLQTKTTHTYSYVVTEETGEYGYSQLRSTVKYWDLIEPSGPYGEYNLIKRVPATAMNPITWDNHFPDDLGPNIWQMQGFAGQNPIDLQAGKVGPFDIFDKSLGFTPNPMFDPLVEDYDSGLGITSLQYQSYVVNGVITLGRYVDTVFESGTFLRIDQYRKGSYIPGMIRKTGSISNSISITLPGSSFNMQSGSIEIMYPEFSGALVYDMHLKKWGKYKGKHYLISDINPLNSGINQGINYTALGTDSVVLSTDGKVYAFDSNPSDSWIRYGKIGYFRLGMTEVYEVKAQMRTESLAFGISVQGSYDGKSFDLMRKHEQWFYDVENATLNSSISGRWHVITISGNYDLTGLEFRGKLAGRR